MEINILFPVLNEHLRLEKGIRKAAEYMRAEIDIPYKLTILDNGSDDDTPEIGKRLAEEFPEVEFVRIEERGVGIAFKTGVERSSADIVGYMDIDLSTDIANLKKTIELFETDPELQYVNASRFHPDSDTRGRKWYRKITSAGLLVLLKACFGMKATDAICGFTFVRRETALQLVQECSDDKGWFYMIEFLLRAERDGIRILDLPVKWTEDYDTTVNVWKTIKNYLKNIWKLKKAFRMEDRRKH
ncbi:MAG: glycosyltransferase [Lachnospiraceae bacterium]|nr:glycosyltransferase [Lachnospiraceae bacterium]